MSDSPLTPNGANDENSWEDMLRAVMGDAAAEEVISHLKAQGMEPDENFQAMLNPANFHAVVTQIKDMLGSSGEGPINWKVAEEVARETLVRQHPDTLTLAEGDRARTALQTANLWLDPAIAIDPCTGPHQAWSRLDWLAHSLPTFKRLTEPVGENLGRAFVGALGSQLDHEGSPLRMFLGEDPHKMIAGLMATTLGVQFGMALSQLAVASFGTADSGLPLVEGQTAALVPANIAAFGEGLDSDDNEVLHFLAVREQAAARLYSRISWLRPQILDTVAAYARDIQIDPDSIEAHVRDFSADPSSMQQLDITQVFSPEQTDYQRSLLARLEHTLSLVEGWINAVSMQAVAAALPHSVALSEMLARRAVTDSPINTTFGPLVDLELRPRKIREATAFWQLALTKRGIEGRDALWAHPDILPTAEDLENPEAFFIENDESDDLDEFLQGLLDSPDEGDTPQSENDEN